MLKPEKSIEFWYELRLSSSNDMERIVSIYVFIVPNPSHSNYTPNLDSSDPKIEEKRLISLPDDL